MPKLHVELGTTLDGVYDCRLDNFNLSELHEIKRISGVRAGEITEALIAGDTDLMLAMAVITLRREGKQPDVESLWLSEAGKLRFDFLSDDEEADGSPPEQPPSGTEPPGENGDGEGISG